MLRTFRGGLLIGLAVAVAVAATAITYERYDTRTLKRTIRRGEVLCGVNKGLPGFSIPDDKGNWTGFDVDFCRAVASAIFNDPSKAKFVALDASERFKELQSRKVDILSRNSTWSMARELDYDLYFPAVAYYDGAGFMLPRSRNKETSLDLAAIKVQRGLLVARTRQHEACAVVIGDRGEIQVVVELTRHAPGRVAREDVDFPA